MQKRVFLVAGILACCVMTVGCPPVYSPCERAMDHYMECTVGLVGEELSGFEGVWPAESIDQMCMFVDIMAPNCNTDAFFNCMAALPCEELLLGSGMACTDELDVESCAGLMP